jgi:hypothetical protein
MMQDKFRENIDLMFSDGIKKEAILILKGIYKGITNYQDISEISPTKSGIFLISELERIGYIKRNGPERTFELCEKGLDYLVSKKLIEQKKENVQTNTLEKEAVISK